MIDAVAMILTTMRVAKPNTIFCLWQIAINLCAISQNLIPLEIVISPNVVVLKE
jgi:hypothetical protein